MSKFIRFMLVVAMVAFATSAVAGPNLEKSGGSLYNSAAISTTDFPGATGCISAKFTADVDLTAGDVVVFSTGTTYYSSVTGTTTAGDPAAIGVVLATASFAGTVEVCMVGVARVNSAVNVVAGTKYVTSGTAGKVTPASSVTETLYTGLSGTAQVVTSLETRTFGAGDSGGYFLGFVGK